jgi:hypothetical protein
MPVRKIKLDFLTKEEISPHLVDLRQKEKKAKRINLVSPMMRFKRVAIFLGLILVFSSFVLLAYVTNQRFGQIKKEILIESEAQMNIFLEATDFFGESDFLQAQNKFSESEEFFSDKIEKIEAANPLINWALEIYPPAKANLNVLRILRDASQAGVLISQLAQEKDIFKEINQDNSGQTPGILPAAILNFNFLEKLSAYKIKFNEIAYLIYGIDKKLSHLNVTYLPENLHGPILLLKKDFPAISYLANNLISFINAGETIFGQDGLKRYLLLFQNNNELRSTGGFLGTYAQIDFDHGKIINFEMPAGGTYDLAGQLNVSVAPPKPLIIAYPKWQFHDANWFPDWPTSAKKLQWFYENSGGVTVDGVFAVNAEILPDILAVIGDIHLENYNQTFTKDNFILEVQKNIELERRQEKDPKKVLVDLAPIILNKIISASPKELLDIFQAINQGMKEKKIMFHFFDQDTENLFAANNLTNNLRESPLDYLMVDSSNVNGAKTEIKIVEDVFYKLEIDQNGSIIATLNIKRTHQGLKDEPFFGKKDLSWVRAYVPSGAVFLGAKAVVKKDLPVSANPGDKDLQETEKEISIDNFSGTRITEEFNKTCFGNFIEIEPGQSNEISFKYLLPFKLNLKDKTVSYSLLLQKQSGRKINFSGEIDLPENRKVIWSHPLAEVYQEGNKIKISSIIDQDKVFAFIIE